MANRADGGKSRKFSSKGLHPRNVHAKGYDFKTLIQSDEDLRAYVSVNEFGVETVNFADPRAVKSLNRALLKHHYGIKAWDIPVGFLCPPIPGRVDYIHHIADLLGVCDPGGGNDEPIRMLDIGTGANGIYGLLACVVYGWRCTASDIDELSLENVASVIAKNPELGLGDRFELRLQTDNSHIFEGIIKEGEMYDVSVCNPPFHSSLEEAIKANEKKMVNLKRNRQQRGGGAGDEGHKKSRSESVLNFGGQKAELWCKGGEIRFLRKMLKESKKFSHQCKWFSSLVSKSENVKPCLKILSKLGANEVKEIEMKQGNKLTRVLAWRF
jgi:23S rRNA (adenine1618-N6)-methyltransferase